MNCAFILTTEGYQLKIQNDYFQIDKTTTTVRDFNILVSLYNSVDMLIKFKNSVDRKQQTQYCRSPYNSFKRLTWDIFSEVRGKS